MAKNQMKISKKSPKGVKKITGPAPVPTPAGPGGLSSENNDFKFRYITITIDKLIPYARNARTHSPDQVNQIAASIKEFGFTNPVIVDEGFGVIAGHGRILGAKKLGLKAVPCIQVTGWTEARKKAYVIADNKLALNAGWDETILGLELAELVDMGFDLQLTGFNPLELGNLLKEVEGLTDPDDIPEPPAEPVAKLGGRVGIGKAPDHLRRQHPGPRCRTPLRNCQTPFDGY